MVSTRKAKNGRLGYFGVAVFGGLVVLFSAIYNNQLSSLTGSYFGGGQGLSPEANTKYVVMIDAGSTGSRLHVYSFDANRQLLNDVFEKVIPGLSSYADNIPHAADSLRPLLDLAVASVPESQLSSTPVAVKATAGLRILGSQKSHQILHDIYSILSSDYPFAIDSVEILDGKDEGLYAWVTANYLLDNLKHDGDSDASKKTAAVFELGGGSTQIVFEPDRTLSSKEAESVLIHGDHRYDLMFNNLSYTLYGHSHLGYGLMEARKKVHKMVVEDANSRLDTGTSPSPDLIHTLRAADHHVDADVHPSIVDGDVLINPCVPPSSSRYVKVRSSENAEITVRMIGDASVSSFEACLEYTEEMLNKDEECAVHPCAFNGVHQPSITNTFDKHEDIYIISYFYDRLFPLNMPTTFPLYAIEDVARKVCHGPDSWQTHFPSSLEELEGRPEYCLDLTFIFSILHHGYGIPLDRNVTVAKSINEIELGWTLGASIAILDKVPNQNSMHYNDQELE